MITNGTNDFHLVSALCGQRLRSLGVGTSFPFPHLLPINAHPQASLEINSDRRDDRLVRAPFEVSDNGISSRVMVLAESLRRAEEVLRAKYPEGEVRLVFPLDGEHVFASHGEDEEILSFGLL
jgi:hypothetical protein